MIRRRKAYFRNKGELLESETKLILKRSRQNASFYQLPEGCQFKEITKQLLESSFITKRQKNAIISNKRKIHVFSYPSDGLLIKGLVSIVEETVNPLTIILLRGGNRIFGTINPADNLMTTGTDTIITTDYRGGISEGVDAFGGDDVNDVENLVDYIPEIERQLSLSIPHEHLFMVGMSRGGMQMFLALGRSKKLQEKCAKLVSLSGVLDFNFFFRDRPDVREIFSEYFGLDEGVNEEEWINLRDPLRVVQNLRKGLPVLIIQGTDDLRVPTQQGINMMEELKRHGNPITYLEIEGADHCLSNREDRMSLILKWLHEDQASPEC